MTNQEGQQFLQPELFLLTNKLEPGTTNLWGKMNAHQMLEHLADFFDVSAGTLHFDLVTPVEHLPKYLEFLHSDKEFRENTKAPAGVLGDEPLPLRSKSFNDAKSRLQDSVASFFDYYQDKSNPNTVHPVFGPLNLADWVTLHGKHVRHHCRQFSLL